MTTITREQLRERAREKVKSLEFAVTQTAFAENRAELEEELELARIALASLTAEPMAWIVHARTGDQLTTDGNYVANAEGILGLHSTPLYAAPPAPVVPDCFQNAVAALESLYRNGQKQNWNERYSTDMAYASGVLNACRAALLQDSQPVSNRDELPLSYLHGHKDGLEWAAQLAEANHPHTGDWLYDDPIALAKAIRKGPDMPPVESGNSPVIPDGYALVPIVPTEDMVIDGFESEPDPDFSDEKEWEEYEALSGCRQAARRAELCWAAMIKAAPKLEAN
ncbi:hypothetical protein [Citrobacter amalonaticus]|uniref:hypothetical protein n=1 Tax=Citrobacter amalonaticus TaxID=35703 RepID=UPI001F3E7047|nr:hypothetical protein [Citrobacter amalonaticus]